MLNGALLGRDSEDGDMLLILAIWRECKLGFEMSSASAPPSEPGRGVACLLIEAESFAVTSTCRDTDGRPCTLLLLLRSSSSAFKIYHQHNKSGDYE